jgi:hypothetical protein
MKGTNSHHRPNGDRCTATEMISVADKAAAKLGRSAVARPGPDPTRDEVERVRAVLAAVPLFGEVDLVAVERLIEQRKARRGFRGLAVLAELVQTAPSPNQAMVRQALHDCGAMDGLEIDDNVARMLLIVRTLQRRRKN